MGTGRYSVTPPGGEEYSRSFVSHGDNRDKLRTLDDWLSDPGEVVAIEDNITGTRREVRAPCYYENPEKLHPFLDDLTVEYMARKIERLTGMLNEMVRQYCGLVDAEYRGRLEGESNEVFVAETLASLERHWAEREGE